MGLGDIRFDWLDFNKGSVNLGDFREPELPVSILVLRARRLRGTGGTGDKNEENTKHEPLHKPEVTVIYRSTHRQSGGHGDSCKRH